MKFHLILKYLPIVLWKLKWYKISKGQGKSKTDINNRGDMA